MNLLYNSSLIFALLLLLWLLLLWLLLFKLLVDDVVDLATLLILLLLLLFWWLLWFDDVEDSLDLVDIGELGGEFFEWMMLLLWFDSNFSLECGVDAFEEGFWF